MKRALMILLAAATALTLAACGTTGVTKSGAAEQTDVGSGAAAGAEESRPAESAAAGANASGQFSEEQIAHIKRTLKVPEDLETEVVIDYDHPSYWEGAGINLLRCEVLRNGEAVASAMVRQDTGELARNIWAYEAGN